MRTIYVEKISPRSLRSVQKLFRSNEKIDRIIFPQAIDFSAHHYNAEVKYLSELLPKHKLLAFEIMERAMEPILMHIQNLTQMKGMQEAMSKALRFPLFDVATSLALAKNLTPQEELFIVTEWPSVHKLMTKEQFSERVHIENCQSRTRLLLQLFWIILEGYLFAGKCLWNLFKPIRGHLQPSVVGIFANYGTPLDLTASIFEKQKPSEIYFHMSPVLETRTFKGREKEDRKRTIQCLQKKGWNWWVFEDRHPLRALKQAFRATFRAFVMMRDGSLLDLRGLLVRVHLTSERWFYEIHDFLQATHLKLLILSEERSPIGNLIGQTTREYGCKTICMFNGFFNDKDPFLKPPPDFNAWALWGPFHEQVFKDLGVPDEKIYLTGHFRSEKWKELSEKIERPTFNSQKLVLGYFSQVSSCFFPDVRNDLTHLLKQVLALEPSLKLLIKAHPLEDYELLKKQWETVDRARLIPRDGTPYDLLKQATLVIGVNSTTLLESLAAGIPAVLYDPMDTLKVCVEMGACLNLFGAKHPENELVALLNNGGELQEMATQARKAALHCLGKLDGRSIERIHEVIHMLLRGG